MCLYVSIMKRFRDSEIHFGDAKLFGGLLHSRDPIMTTDSGFEFRGEQEIAFFARAMIRFPLGWDT